MRIHLVIVIYTPEKLLYRILCRVYIYFYLKVMFGTKNNISLSVPHATWHDSTSRELTESLLLGRRLEMSALPWATAPDNQGLDNEWVESGVDCGCDGVKEWGREGEASQCQREQSCEQVKRWFGCRRWNFSSHTVEREWNTDSKYMYSNCVAKLSELEVQYVCQVFWHANSKQSCAHHHTTHKCTI